ncbi:MAG: autotransporter domain-containing protein, partial [Pseudomonadota bacterium]
GGYGGNAYLYVANVTTSSSANVNTTVGGAGGSGNTGGTVNVTNGGAISVGGDNASGLYVQSTGGGGGRAGSAGSIIFSLTRGTPEDDTNVTGNVTTNVGGAGGSGHHGGEVTVTNNAAITVDGTGGYGIFAQSIGGGGGDGGNVSGNQVGVQGNGCSFSTSLSSAISCTGASGQKSTYSLAFNIEIGGNGGGGGDGDAVTVNNIGDVTTTADTTFGIFAQSTGGGGGVGGNAALGTESSLPQNMVTKEADYFADFGDEFFGTLKTFQTAKIVIGGNGGAAGDGGDVLVKNSGTVTTKGQYSDAIHAHSVGGGGGHGGTGNLGFGSLISFALGGQGGAGGDGGDVTVNSTGEVVTEGDDAIGIFAQSVGGGGGRAGNITRVLEGEFGVNLNIGKGVGVQLSGGNGGDGGDVSVTVDGIGLTSSGDYAHGVWAQSTGGSGGAAHIGSEGTSVAVSFAGGNGAAPGNSGKVDVTVDAPITVSGTGAIGIFAQSASGTKGAGEGGNSGDVTITVNADIKATGTDGGAMILQSDANVTAGTVAVTIAEGATVSSPADGVDTIAIQDGTRNTITNNGTIAMAETSSTTAYAVHTKNSGITITNAGTFEGSISLETEDPFGDTVDNIFTNTGTLGVGRTFDLGYKTSSLSNQGVMSAGTVGTIGASDISGTLTQTSTGTLQVDIDIVDGNDAITISGGNSATLAGSVLPNIIGNLPVSGDSDALTIVTSSVGLTTTDLTVSNTSTVGYTLTQQTDSSGDEELLLTYLVDYTPWDPETSTEPGTTAPDASGFNFNANHTAVGNYVDTLVRLRRADVASGENALEFIDDFVLTLLKIEETQTLLNVYEQMTPVDVMVAAEAATQSSLRFANRLMSCPGRDEDGAAAFGEEGSCIWADVSGVARDMDRNGTAPSATEAAFALAGGAQFEIAPGWFTGAALGYESYRLDTSFSDGDGLRIQGGAVLKKVFGGTTLAGSVSGGFGTFDVTRDLLPTVGTTASTADADMRWIAGHLRAAHRFALTETAFLEPLIDAGVTHVHTDPFTMRGGFPFDLDVSSTDSTVFSVNPAARIGTSFSLAGLTGEARLRGGILALFGSDTFDGTVAASGLGADSVGFEATADRDELYADLGIAIEAAMSETIALEAKADALIGENNRQFSAGLRLSLSF